MDFPWQTMRDNLGKGNHYFTERVPRASRTAGNARYGTRPGSWKLIAISTIHRYLILQFDCHIEFLNAPTVKTFPPAEEGESYQ
jgi:hypothetical protein